MLGAGAGTHIGGYAQTVKLRSLRDVYKEIDAYRKLGVKLMMFESEGITEDLPKKQWRTDLISKVIKRYGINSWMFEAADPVVFKWYLQRYGREVNLFIDHSQIIEYEAWRSKLWGDPSIWKGKKLTY